jgi:hypothetical protein
MSDDVSARRAPIDELNIYFLNSDTVGWICSPIGGFGNHIRWMLTLDAKIQAKIYTHSKHFWPYYTIDDKLIYISKYVYGNFRTWHNWLHTEWKIRKLLDPVIPLEHHYTAQSEITRTYKGILCTVSPDLALRCYLKFNSSLNNMTIDGFQLSIKSMSHKLKTYARLNNCLCLDADTLYTEVLDRDFYASMIDYLGFDDNYESAAVIHAQWYQLHQKAEQEFVDYVTNFYRPEPNNNIGKTLNTAIGL